MDGDLAEVLGLLHVSSRRWRTLRAAGIEWQDADGSLKAFQRRPPPSSVITMRGTPGPPDRDPRWQLWIRQPDLARVEFGGPHQTRITEITNGARVWTTIPGAGGVGRIHERRGGGRAQLGPSSQLVATRVISAALDLEEVERTHVLGREAFAVRARPTDEELRPGPGLFNSLVRGSDEVRLAVDAERGVVLRIEAFLDGSVFYRVEITELAFDEEIPDERFALPEAEGPESVLATPGQRPSNARRRPRLLHDGPPDNVIGQPVQIEAVLAQADAVVVAVDRVVAYPTGFELHVTVRTRDEQLSGTTEPAHPRSWAGSAAFPGESLRLGVAFSDGRRVTTDDQHASVAGDLRLIPLSGTGTSCRFDQRFWVQPLPPEGPLRLLAEWSRRGLPETGVDVPGGAIIEAATRATVLWTHEN